MGRLLTYTNGGGLESLTPCNWTARKKALVTDWNRCIAEVTLAPKHPMTRHITSCSA